MTSQAKSKEQPKEKFTEEMNDPFWGICLMVLICMGAGSMWAISYFGTKGPTAPVNHVPGVFSWRTDPHRSLMDIDMPEVLIGFKSAGRVYLDASSFCDQPGFRSRAELDRPVAPQTENMGKLLVETPDISLPESLDHRILSVVSADMAPEVRVFDSPYQWLGDAYGPSHGACMLLGKKTARGEPQRLDTLDAVPIIALTSIDTPADLHLKPQAKPLRVMKDNRAASIRKHPWLLRWLKEFSSNASKQCGPGEFKPLTVLMPVQTRLSLTSEQNTHWMAASACDGESDWSLVVTNEDETVSFVRLGRLRGPDDYRPAQVWATDIDADGTPEFLVWAQYPKGWRYVLLRLHTDDEAGHSLTEITKTAYVAL
jgi:hypothetical protein